MKNIFKNDQIKRLMQDERVEPVTPQKGHLPKVNKNLWNFMPHTLKIKKTLNSN